MQSCNFPDEHRRQTLDDIFGAKRGSVCIWRASSLIRGLEVLCLVSGKPLIEIRSISKMAGFSIIPNRFEGCEGRIEFICRTGIKATGLGSPPEMFTANASDVTNSVLKSKVDYRSKLHKFVEKMQCLVDEQERKDLTRSLSSRKVQILPCLSTPRSGRSTLVQHDTRDASQAPLTHYTR